MRLDLRPEPPPGEREALTAALERLLEEPERRPSAWWEAGLRESALGDGPAAEEAWGDPRVIEP